MRFRLYKSVSDVVSCAIPWSGALSRCTR